MRSSVSLRALCCAVLTSGLFCCQAVVAAANPVDFNRQIRPLLADKCFACHGPDEGKRDSQLRLDTQAGALAEIDGHHAVVPSKPDESELVRRITSDDPDKRMPPADSNKKLSAEEIELIRQWVAEGATWREHWAYRAPVRQAVPAPAEQAPQASAIDAFVRARLTEQKLEPAPPADRATLVRRLYLDLTGLPPSPGQVEAFARDESAEAYERLVDSLLASPHYGERMAQYWLDLVRYADSAGYHSDNDREVWLYRDYVIGAFNANKPFDRFTREQLAGDLLSDASEETRLASGYNRLLQTTEEGGAQAREYTAKYAADRVRNVASVWLASTMGCAECHNHKFDPFTTRQFYNMQAFFADLSEKAVGRQDQTPFPTPDQAARLAAFDAEMASLRKTLDTQTPELDAALAKWESTLPNSNVDWRVLKPIGAVSTAGTALKILDDASILAETKAVEEDHYTIVLPVSEQDLTGLRLEVLADPSLPASGPGRAANGNFVLSQVRVAAVSVADPEARAALVALENASADHEQEKFPVAAAIDGKPETGWAVSPAFGKNHVAMFEFKEPIANPGGTILWITLDQNFGASHAIGRFRLSVTNSAKPLRVSNGLPGPLATIVATAAADRTPEQRQQLAAHYRSIAPELASERARLAEQEKAKAEFSKTIPQSLVAMAVATPRTIRVLPRGNWLSDDGEIVEPVVPTFIAPFNVADRRPTRLDLADWIVARDNPLTARVLVNRLWKLTFGQGLVKSLEDFGSQGVTPTHPELLDWLAVELMETDWDIKRMMKLLVMSDTYRQSSTPTPAQHQHDPENKWLARQSRFRLEAEEIRDSALATSGLLVRKVGGASVKPYQPDGYWTFLNFPARSWVADKGENQYRRGLYTWWQRTFLQPSLLAFDAPTREECTVDRVRSNTPLQALVLLNDSTYVEAARVFAERILKEGGGEPQARLQWAFREALSRPANEAELAVLLPLVSRSIELFKADPAAVEKLLAVGDSPKLGDLDPTELAAWTQTARVIFNLHEFVTRD
jgi:mono/diheme cytochrome c family protein